MSSYIDLNDFVNEEKRRKNKRAWISSLKDHLPENKLPEFKIVYYELKSNN